MTKMANAVAQVRTQALTPGEKVLTLEADKKTKKQIEKSDGTPAPRSF